MKRNIHLQMIAEDRHRIFTLVTVIVTAAIGGGVNASDETPLPIDEAAEQVFRASVGGGFSRSRSEHFVMLHDLGIDEGRAFLRRMETTYDRVRHFCDAYNLPQKPLSRRFEVFCSTELGLFERLSLPKAGFSMGVYDPVSRRCYFDFSWRREPRSPAQMLCGMTILAIKEGERVTAQHETAHQVIDHFCPTLSANMPEWLAEGLACAFEPEPSAGVEAYRLLNERRARDVMGMLDPTWPGEDGVRPPRPTEHPEYPRVNVLEMINTERPPETGGLGPPAAMVRRSRWYAVAWSTVFYLQQERAEAFKSLLHEMNSASWPAQDRDQRKMLDKIIGPIDERLQERIYSHLRLAMDKNGSRGG